MKNELQTLRLFSPLFPHIYRKNEWGERGLAVYLDDDLSRKVYSINPTVEEWNGEHIEFQTAWSYPDPVISALSKQYPDLRFEVRWADEDFEYNTGKKEYENGEAMFCHIPPGGSKEALELAAEVRSVDLTDEGYLYNEETGEYEYHHLDKSMSLKM